MNTTNDAIAYHLVPDPWYTAQPPDQAYLPEPFDHEGFVHLTHGIEPVIAAGNRYYRSDPRSYVVLTVDLTKVTSEVRYEDADHQFPHIYGPIDREAIVAVRVVERGADGTFLTIAEEADSR